MTRKELLELRNKDIKKRYSILTIKRHFSVDYALEVMEKEFYITMPTLWLIISGTGHYKNSK